MIRLTAQKLNIEAHYKMAAPLVLKRISKILVKNGWKGTNLSSWLRWLLEFLVIGENLRQLINANCEEMRAIIDIIKDGNTDLLKDEEEDFILIKNIFHNAGYGNINKAEFIRNNGINTCPYCNRNYIYSASNKVKPQIDHFFPTSLYPLFAVSFYNLIPACEPCNGLYGKNNQDSHKLRLVSPYEIKPSDYNFTYKVINISIINPVVGKSEIELILNGSPRVAGNTEVFNLDKFYPFHSDHILELIIKQRVRYSEKYKQYLNSYEGLKFSNSEIDTMILGNVADEKHQHKRSLAKLYQDIGLELKLIRR